MATFPSSLRAACITLVLSICLSSTAYASEDPSEPIAPVSRLQELSARASELAIRALGLIGIQYRYGGNVPDNGLDCSGLVRYLFKEVWGTDLPRTSVEMSQLGQQVASTDLQPGDLVFYNTLRRSFSHVGVYLGDKKFIHAPSSGGQVRIESMDLKYWQSRFNGARRLNQSE